jgi:hypothetical protein
MSVPEPTPGQRAFEAHLADGGACIPGAATRWASLDPADQARWEQRAEDKARQERLIAEHGDPESIGPSDALALAATGLVPIAADVTSDDIWASIYRDTPAADAWMNANLVHHGHPELERAPLPDGRVVGILDLRPSLERSRREAREGKLRAGMRAATHLRCPHGRSRRSVRCWGGTAGSSPRCWSQLRTVRARRWS